jgi:flagellar hook-associated protein 1 FlgK
MANGMGSLYIGASSLQNHQNALNTTANNLANVETTGYVRQQVLFQDKSYVTFDKSNPVAWQQSGLGVSIGDVVHTRDIFKDKLYRSEVGRQAFYESSSETVNYIEDLFQELEGGTFQDTMDYFYNAFNQLSNEPDLSVAQNLVINQATIFKDSVQSIYDGMAKYQKDINKRVVDTVARINELGKEINELNEVIQKIETGGIETAMTYRDQRDNALDELGSLANIQYKEIHTGAVKVKLEGVTFVDEVNVYEMGSSMDPVTDFLSPYWPHLADKDDPKRFVFDTSEIPSSAGNTDIGGLKALILARGDYPANYNDIVGKTASQFNAGAGNAIIMTYQAEFDQMVHGMVTAINDILCPNTEVDDGTGRMITVWDFKNGTVNINGEGPGQELFVRSGTPRYTPQEINGITYYVYNEEDPSDTSKQYTIKSLDVNPALLDNEGNLPMYKQISKDPANDVGKALYDVWSKELMTVNPNDTDKCSFSDYYKKMIDQLANEGQVYGENSVILADSVANISNDRQGVLGVSSDEELTNMIKYQNAYNAASRYINVVSEMLEHLVTQL